jgi:hypothetical protein
VLSAAELAAARAAFERARGAVPAAAAPSNVAGQPIREPALEVRARLGAVKRP